MFEKINADVSANYTDRNIDMRGSFIEIGISSDNPESMWISVPIGNKREDDTLIITFRMDDFLSILGKAIVREYKGEE